MTERMQAQKWVEAAILLSLWTRSAKKPWEDAGDRLRLMKLAFLTTHDLYEQRFKALDLTFYRWTWGPLSNEVHEAWETLIASGLMEEEERFLVTEDGVEIASSFEEEVLGDELNHPVQRTIDRIAEAWAGRMATEPILDHVYGMKIRPVGSERKTTVRATGLSAWLTAPLDGLDVSGSFSISNAWIETLGQYFSPSNDAALLKAEEDFRERRFVVSRSA